MLIGNYMKWGKVWYTVNNQLQKIDDTDNVLFRCLIMCNIKITQPQQII